MDSVDVFLNAGDFHFHRVRPGEQKPLVLRTLLGSCVSVVLWHPATASGGMCHAVLPAPTRPNAEFDGNHCDGAMRLFLRETQRLGFPPQQYRAYLMGGARMSMGLREPDKMSVGERNVERFRDLLKRTGFNVSAEHTGLSGARRIKFFLNGGRIEVLHGNQTILLAE